MRLGGRAVAISLAVVAFATGCSGGDRERTEVLVSTAASLTDVFAAIEIAFEGSNPDIDVVFNVGGSSGLREQILAGAPADVFASANMETMQAVVDANLVAGPPLVFAVNTIQVAVPVGNPAEVGGLEDFARPELLLGMCAEPVPCGAFAREALAAAGVEASIDTNEPDVRSLLTKVEAGELDAGIVYATDIAARSGRVDGVSVPEDVNVTAVYVIASLAGGGDLEKAGRFVDFVLSTEGQTILRQQGFGAP